MKALITGISGFVGLYLAEYLLDQGDEVLGCEPRGQWSEDAPDRVRQAASLMTWDLSRALPATARRQVIQFSPDCIFHLAAISVPADCGAAEPSPLSLAVNVEGTQSVLDLARSLPSPPRVLVTSSSHVYAPVTQDRPRVDEHAPLGPINAYGTTKLQAEERCLRAARQGLDVVIVRAFQHSGPRQLPKFMLPEWAEQFACPGNEPIRVITLDSYLDLSDVRDVVRAYDLLIKQGGRGIYNVGSGVCTRSGDVFQQLLDLTGRTREVVESRPGLRQHAVADPSRLAADTSWRPRIPLRQTVADTLAYWQSRYA